MIATTQQATSTPTELILWDVVMRHFDEAKFYFAQFQRGLSSPVFVMGQIRNGFEDSLEQHLIGLLTAGVPAAERLLYPELEEMTSPERTTLAALVFLRLSERKMLYELLDFLSSSQDAAHRGAILRAVTLNDDPRFETVLREAYSRARSPREKAMLLEVFASIHLDPGDLLGDCFDTGFTKLDVAALEAAGRAGRRDLVSAVDRALLSEDPMLRSTAMEAGLFLGSNVAWSACREMATMREAQGARAMLLVAMFGSAEDHRIIHRQVVDRSMREAALWALGFTGRIESAELCLQYLESDNERTAKLAAEAFGAITGLIRLPFDLILAKPEENDKTQREGTVPFEQDDLDAELVPDGTDELPLLDPFEVASWYEGERARLSKGKRYLAGKVYCAREVVGALSSFTMRRRHALALELAIRTGAKRWVTTDVFTTRQLRELEALQSLDDEELVNWAEDDEAE